MSMPDDYKVGMQSFREGDYDRAFSCFSAITEVNETDHKAWNALGVTCMKLGRQHDAIICFNNALLFCPDNEIYLKNKEKTGKKLTLAQNDVRPYGQKKTSSRNRSQVRIKFIVGILGLIGMTLILFIVASGFISESTKIVASYQELPMINL